MSSGPMSGADNRQGPQSLRNLSTSMNGHFPGTILHQGCKEKQEHVNVSAVGHSSPEKSPNLE